MFGFGMVWYGMVWYGIIWYGWYGIVWFGMVWYGMVKCLVWCGMYDLTFADLTKTNFSAERRKLFPSCTRGGNSTKLRPEQRGQSSKTI